jgi:iron complex outermembrane receptor protein
VDHLKLGQKGPVDQPTIFTKEDFDRSITAWSFNGAVLFKLDDYSSLRIAGGRGIQTPSLLALGERVSLSVPGLPVPFVFAGDPGLAPTVVKSAEIGLARQLDQIGGRLELTVFYDHSSDLVGVPGLLAPPRAGPPAVPFLINTYRNVGSFESYGLSASLAGRFKQSWSWMLNYSWTKANQDITGNQGGMFPWLLALDSATPEHKIKGQLSYERGPWLATGAARYTSRIDQLKNNPATPPMLVRIGANIVLDAKVAYKVNNALTFAITGENLTNNHNADLSPVPAERRLHASLQVRF